MENEIKAHRIMPGILKPTQHYLLHLAHMIEKQGCLKSYSARSMERTIGQFKRVINAKTNVGTNAGNILERLAMMSTLENMPWDTEEEVSLITTRGEDVYLEHPSGEQDSAQLWKPFEACTTTSLPLDVSADKFKNALEKNYVRLYNCEAESLDTEVLVAHRCWLSNTVYASHHYQKRVRSTRGNQYVMFDVGNAWFVGAVVFFFRHVHRGKTLFLVLIELAKNHKADDDCHRVLCVELDGSKTYVVCPVESLVCRVGLVKYNTRNSNLYKVVSQYIITLRSRSSSTLPLQNTD